MSCWGYEDQHELNRVALCVLSSCSTPGLHIGQEGDG